MSANGKLFVLDLSGGRVMSVNTDGTDLKTLVSEGRHLPDGVVVDVEAGYIYWTNMGVPSHNDGRIMRAGLDGSKPETLVDTSKGDSRPGPDQTKWCVGIALDTERGHIYWTQK